MRLRDIISGLHKVWQDPNKPNTTTIYSNNLARNYPLRWNKSKNTATITNVTTNIDLTVLNEKGDHIIKMKIPELDIEIFGIILAPDYISWILPEDPLDSGKLQ